MNKFTKSRALPPAAQKVRFFQTGVFFFKPRAVCADRAYDSNALRAKISALGAVPVIPSKKNRRAPVAHDPVTYRRRNVVERYFRRLKNQRKLALRTDKTKAAFLAWVWVAEAVDILKTKS